MSFFLEILVPYVLSAVGSSAFMGSKAFDQQDRKGQFFFWVKLHNVFVKTAKSICLILKMYLYIMCCQQSRASEVMGSQAFGQP